MKAKNNFKHFIRKELQLLGMKYSDLHLIETPWQHVSKSSEVNGEYKTDDGELPIIYGGTGIPVKKTDPSLEETWKKMEYVQNLGLTKVSLWLKQTF